jgi:CheY-like chemotaxis protein
MNNPFLVSLGQQIRSPMNSLIGVTESLLETDLTPAQRSMAEVARGAAEALLDVINEMVVLSGLQDGRMNLESVNLDLAGMVGSVARLYAADAKQAGLELTCRVDGDLPQNVVGDPGRLRQILAALIENAIKFTESGSVGLTVEIGSGEGSPTPVRFTVRDTGIGIPQEKVRSILNEPGQICGTGQDSHWGGEGHGLAIAQLILLLMESRLEIESEPGTGSVFSFELELPRAESVRSDTRRDDWLHLENARVLAVCDSAAQRRTIGEMLGCAGMCVTGVGDAASASSALAEPGPDPFQLVIIDSYLPGADCFDLAVGIHGLGGCAGLPLMCSVPEVRRVTVTVAVSAVCPLTCPSLFPASSCCRPRPC